MVSHVISTRRFIPLPGVLYFILNFGRVMVRTYSLLMLHLHMGTFVGGLVYKRGLLLQNDRLH
jgi:hypothetical protein